MSLNIGDKVQDLIGGIIMAVVLLAVGVALGPTVLEEAAKINATSMADVQLGSVIVLLANYIGFFYYFGITIGAIMMIWAYAKFK